MDRVALEEQFHNYTLVGAFYCELSESEARMGGWKARVRWGRGDARVYRVNYTPHHHPIGVQAEAAAAVLEGLQAEIIY